MGDDDDLARRAVAGDNAAFDSLVRMHQSAVRGFLRRLSGNDHALADDLAQDTFFTAFQKKHQFVAGSFLSWLYSIAWSRFLMQSRQRKTETLREDSHAASLPEQSSVAKLDLEKALNRVTPAECAAITLCLGLGYVHEEAAAILGIPLGTLKSHVARGRDKIVAMLENDHGR